MCKVFFPFAAFSVSFLTNLAKKGKAARLPFCVLICN